MTKRFCDICGAEIRTRRYCSVRLTFGGKTHCDKSEACEVCVNKIKETFNSAIAGLKHATKGGVE